MTWELAALDIDACQQEMKLLREYFDLTETFLMKKRAQFEETYAEVLRDHEFYDAMSDDISQLWEGFPTTLLSMTLVAACSCIESAAAILCKKLDSEATFPKRTSWGDVRDRGLRRAAAFMKENFDIYLDDHAAWHSLCDYAEIRNCIVHAAGESDSVAKAAPLLQAVKRRAHDGVSIDKDGRLRLTPAFATRALSTIDAFWEALREALRQNATIGPHYWP